MKQVSSYYAIYKVLNKSAPLYLHDVFAYATSITENSHRLFVPQINTHYGKGSFYYHGVTIWNALCI